MFFEMESEDRIRLIQYIMDFEKEDIESKEGFGQYPFNRRFDELYDRPIEFLIKKYKIYHEIFS